MSLWSRIFSHPLRQARAAHAAGELEQAARLYGEAGETLRAAEVLVQHADAIDDAFDKVEAYQRAFAQHPAIGPAQLAWAQGYADAVMRSVELSAAIDRSTKRRLADAGQALLAAGAAQRAGELFALAEWHEHAADAFARAGAVVALDASAVAADETRQAASHEERAVATYELAVLAGDLLGARAALEEGLVALPQNRRLASLEEALTSRFPAGCTLALRGDDGTQRVLHGGASLVIGRGSDADWSLRAPGLSRRHARLTRAAAEVHVESVEDAAVRVDGEVAPRALGTTGEVELAELVLRYARGDGGSVTLWVPSLPAARAVWASAWVFANETGLGPRLALHGGYWHVDPRLGEGLGSELPGDHSVVAVDGTAWSCPRLLTTGAQVSWPGGGFAVE